MTMKQRLINRLYNAKKKLTTDKEHLDIADTNALLLHPSQFSLGSGPGGVLGSPGGKGTGSADMGGMSMGIGIMGLGDGGLFGASGGVNVSGGGRRKLRQRRGELEDLMLMNQHQSMIYEGNGDSNRSSSKRKARAARSSRRNAEEEEANGDDLFGQGAATPNQSGNNNNSGVGAAQLASLLQKQQANGNGGTGATADSNNNVLNQDALLHKPVWSIEKLFTDKELQMAGNLAALATVKYFSAPKKEKGKKRRRGSKQSGEAGTTGQTGGDDVATEGAGSASEINEAATDGVRTPRVGEAPAGEEGTVTLATALGAASSSSSSSATMPHDLSNVPLLPTPATIFRDFNNQYQKEQQQTSQAMNTRATNNSKDAAASALMNLNQQVPPPLAALSFMTPSQYGYGSAAWTALGVPANFFSAGSGGVVNANRTANMAAPTAPGLRAEEVAEDLDVIRRGLVIEDDEPEGADADDSVDEEDSDPEGDVDRAVERIVQPLQVAVEGKMDLDIDVGADADVDVEMDDAAPIVPIEPVEQEKEVEPTTVEMDVAAKKDEKKSTSPPPAASGNPESVVADSEAVDAPTAEAVKTVEDKPQDEATTKNLEPASTSTIAKDTTILPPPLPITRSTSVPLSTAKDGSKSDDPTLPPPSTTISTEPTVPVRASTAPTTVSMPVSVGLKRRASNAGLSSPDVERERTGPAGVAVEGKKVRRSTASGGGK